jgi:hypothetical protein
VVVRDQRSDRNYNFETYSRLSKTAILTFGIIFMSIIQLKRLRWEEHVDRMAEER